MSNKLLMIMASPTTFLVATTLLLVAVCPSDVVSLTFRQLHFPAGKGGGESIAFETPGGVFYTGVRDGVILQYRGAGAGWQEFAYTAPTRSSITCDNTTNPNLGPVCGYPLGLAYNVLTKQLIIADAYQGLLAVRPNTRLATPLATSAEGVPFVATNAVDIDQTTGNIYFTDSSTRFQIRNSTLAVNSNDTTGRLMMYNASTGQVTVLLRNLGYPGGLALSNDGTFLLVVETSLNKTTRFWLRGPQANTAEPFIADIVRPDNIRRTAVGDFWIAARQVNHPSMTQRVSIRVRVDRTGRVSETTPLVLQYGDIRITEVQQSGAELQLHFPSGRPRGFSVVVAPNGVLFAGVLDGLILQYRPSTGWSTFARLTATRVNATCDNTTDPNLFPVCGYPLGLAYDGLTGQLYVADSYQGLMVAGPEPGMLATPLVTAVDGVRFRALSGIDINPLTRIVYFTDCSTNYPASEWMQAIRKNDTSGRLMQYNTNTQQVTVLLRGLGFPGGVAVSADGSFLLLSESSLNRTTRFWLSGPMANTSEPFITNLASPLNIKRTALGEFLIAANLVNLASRTLVPIAVRADRTERIIKTTSLSDRYGDLLVTEVHQPLGNETYISSIYTPFAGIYEGPV
ncbi:Protein STRICTOSIDINE SYNTHASE-LIKE 10 [Linum perenne]